MPNPAVAGAAAGPPTPLATSLTSPWALWHHGNDLYIAMAGTHQIWKMPLDESSIGAVRRQWPRGHRRRPLLPSTRTMKAFASFAQPSGLASDGKQLFVADSEGSTVRAVPFDPKGTVRTLVGLTGTLFDFGDVDGTGQDVRLQHPLGVAWADGKLYVADTYNNKIKVIDVEQRSCRTSPAPAGPEMRTPKRARTQCSTSRPEFRRPAAGCTWRIRTITRFASWS